MSHDLWGTNLNSRHINTTVTVHIVQRSSRADSTKVGIFEMFTPIMTVRTHNL